MRHKEKFKYANEKSNIYISKELSRLVGLSPSPNSFKHIVHLFMLGMIHQVAEKARDSDKRLDKVEIEIPFVGKMIITISGENLILDDIRFEEEFKHQVLDAVNEGKSPLAEHMNKKLISNVQNKYKELL